MANYVIRIVPGTSTPQFFADPSSGNFLVIATGVSVASLKVDIERKTGIPNREQELIWNGRPLSDQTSLSEIPGLSTLNLLRRTATGASHAPNAARETAAAPAPATETPRQAESSPDDDACAICLEGYSPSFPPVTLRCRHGFHETCIMQWAQQSGFCPLCRERMELLPSLYRYSQSSAVATGQAQPPSGPGCAPAAGGGTMYTVPAQHLAAAGVPVGQQHQQQQMVQQGVGAPTVGFGVPAGQAPGQMWPQAAGVAAGGGLALMLAQTTTTPAVAPTRDAINRMLASTRTALSQSSDFRTMSKAVAEFRDSEAGRTMGRGVQIAAGAALGLALGAGNLAAQTIINNSTVARNMAAAAGYDPRATNAANMPHVSPAARTGVAAGLGAVAAVAGAAASAAALLASRTVVPGTVQGTVQGQPGMPGQQQYPQGQGYAGPGYGATAANSQTVAAAAAMGAGGANPRGTYLGPAGGYGAPAGAAMPAAQQAQGAGPGMAAAGAWAMPQQAGAWTGAYQQGPGPQGQYAMQQPAMAQPRPQVQQPPVQQQQQPRPAAPAPAPAAAAPGQAPRPNNARCPNCGCLMHPPPGAGTFRCPCGTLLRR